MTPYAQTPGPMLGADPYTSFLDPSKAPLKHINIVLPSQINYTKDITAAFNTADGMIDRLLDEKLAEDDPFQATMGLVLLSQLGLEWDYE
jgi:hypothetical protein